MKPDNKSLKLKDVLSLPDPDARENAINDFLVENRLSISVSQFVAVAKMVCAASASICPLIDKL